MTLGSNSKRRCNKLFESVEKFSGASEVLKRCGFSRATNEKSPIALKGRGFNRAVGSIKKMGL
jgi:hypothetical protein